MKSCDETDDPVGVAISRAPSDGSLIKINRASVSDGKPTEVNVDRAYVLIVRAGPGNRSIGAVMRYGDVNWRSSEIIGWIALDYSCSAHQKSSIQRNGRLLED